MKKILFVVMMMALASAAFAKQVVLLDNKAEGCVILSESSLKGKDFEKEFAGWTDEMILDYADKHFSEGFKSKGYIVELTHNEIETVDYFAKKYSIYWVVDYNMKWTSYTINLGNNRQLTLRYYVKNIGK